VKRPDGLSLRPDGCGSVGRMGMSRLDGDPTGFKNLGCRIF